MRLGYMTWGMPTVPAEESIPFLAGLGFRAVELTVLPHYADTLARLDGPVRARIRSLLAAHGLALPAIAAHFGLLAPGEGTAAARQMADLEAAARVAADLAPAGAAPPVLDTTAGGEPSAWDAVRERLAERTGQLCRAAAAHGVEVAVEPHVHSCLDRPDRVLWLLRAVGERNLRVNLDISHFDVQGMDVAAVCAALAPWSAHVHVKDQRGRAPDFAFLVPGEGDFDCAAFLVALQAAGYAGCVTVEVSIMAQRRPGYDPWDAARRSFAWLRAAFDRAGVGEG